MARAKGTPKTGGRQKGTPNKTTAAVRASITAVVSEYTQTAGGGSFGSLQEDLRNMLPVERARIVAQLVGYIIPKQQAITIEEQTAIEAEALTQWLQTAPAEAIEGIAAKVLELQAKNSAARQTE